MNLLIFILACYGLTSILIYGKIFEKVRPNNHLFKCSQCMGFWSGVLVNIILCYLGHGLFANWFVGSIIGGWISSGTSYMLDKIVSDDGIQIKKK